MDTRTVHGVELAYVDRGTGPAVVLVHGFPLDHSMWDAQIESLSAEYRVIAPDLRGFGRSGATPATATMEQFADDLAGLLDAIGVRHPVVLCGLSMGGYVAFAFWRRHAARLRGLILCDTRAAPDTADVAGARLQTAARVLDEGPALLAETMLPRLLAPSTSQRRPQIVQSLQRVVGSASPQGVAAALRGMAQRSDATPILHQIRCPTLVIVGQFDVISPVEEMRQIAQAIPQSRLVEIPDAGHMSPMENPAAVNRAMQEFLVRATGTATGS